MRPSCFPYPLPEYALREFCATRAGSPLVEPLRHGGELLAGNGWLALRCARGAWIDAEMRPACAEYLERFEGLPWEALAVFCGEWKTLERGGLYERGQIAWWVNGRPGASPVWKVGRALVRLAMLQQVSRLPRVEVAWLDEDGTPLFLRFSGGVGMVAYDPTLTLFSHLLFGPRVDGWTGEIVRPGAAAGMRGNFGKAPAEDPPLDDWPPEEQI